MSKEVVIHKHHRRRSHHHRRRSKSGLGLVVLVVLVLLVPLSNVLWARSFVRRVTNRFFHEENLKQATNESSSTAAVVGPTPATSAAAQAFSKLHLLITTFPDGFEQDFRPVFIRTLEFFWPREHIRLTVVLDATVATTPEERSNMTQQVLGFFDNATRRDQIHVVFQPNTDPLVFGPGYDIQQNIGFWADNFTDAEFIGIVDDDTLFTRAIQPRDLFDDQGRPHTICHYPAGVDPAHLRWKNGTHWALGRPGYLTAMNYFPVVLHRKYFAKIRHYILHHVHPGKFANFDAFFQQLWSRKKDGYSQFEIMFEYLWHHHRHDFNWHLEPAGRRHDQFPHGLPPEAAAQWPHIQTGTPQDNHVTALQLRPFPRIAVHGSWIPGGRMAHRRKRKVVQLMKQGYCFSQPWDWIVAAAAEGDDDNSTSNNSTTTATTGATTMTPPLDPTMKAAIQRRCRAYRLTTDLNIAGGWLFELAEKWPSHDPNGTALAHLERMKHNDATHHFSPVELGRIFGNDY